ncbi:MAG: hypothetical protein ACMUIE_03420, partial [Thermoplasmatota archaeon]
MKNGSTRIFLVGLLLFITFFIAPLTDLRFSSGQDGVPTRAEVPYTFNATEDEPFNGFLQNVNI